MRTHSSMLGSILLISILGLSSCKKEDEGLKVQSHDENKMMSIMHQMMSEMDKMTPMRDPDHDFAMMMQMHHQAAIDMAKEELKSGDDTQMKAIAQRVIDAQQAEINQFKAYLASSPMMDTTGNAMFQKKQMEAMDKMMKANDLRVLTGDADQDFASLMIDHHQSAIETSEAEVDLGNENPMKMMAQKIIEDQKKEINELQEWLLKNKSY